MMALDDKVKLALRLYGEARKAAEIIKKQLEIFMREDSDDNWSEREESYIERLVSRLEHIANMTNVPEDQAKFEYMQNQIDSGNYPVEQSPYLQKLERNKEAARQAIMKHHLFNELCILIEEHNKAGGWGSEMLVDALWYDDVLNYPGEKYHKFEYGIKMIKHNGKIKALQKRIAADLPGVYAKFAKTYKGQKYITGYDLRGYMPRMKVEIPHE